MKIKILGYERDFFIKMIKSGNKFKALDILYKFRDQLIKKYIGICFYLQGDFLVVDKTMFFRMLNDLDQKSLRSFLKCRSP